jgi:hypothetical protein
MFIRATPLGFLIVISAAPGISSLGAAQQAGVTISITPDSLVVAPGLEDRAFITIANTSDSTLFALRFTSLPAAGIRVRFSDSLIPSVPRGAVVATTLFIARESNGPRPAALVIRADYRNGRQGIARIVLSTVKLVANRLEAPEQAADVKLSSSTETLNEKQPGKVYVIVTNKLDLPIVVSHIRSRSPVFTAVDSSLGGSIPPHGAQAFEINLRAKQRVQPGKYTVVFDVALSWPSTSGTRNGNVLLPRELDVGVFGESAILKMLSVPSFLLLPGFLMIVAFGLAWQFQRRLRGAKAAESPLKPTSADFWVIAITLSGLMAVVYPRDYLSAYGTRDLVEVWLVSVLLGAVASAAWFSWTYVWRTPSATDSPVTVLRKLGRQGLGIERERVNVSGGDRYLLQRLPEDDEEVWAGATIKLTWEAEASSKDRDRLYALRNAGKAGPLADFLKGAQARQVIRVDWKPPDATPLRVPKVTPIGTGSIVEV